MKCLIRYCCVLFVVVLSLVVFSVSVSAEGVDVPRFSVTHSVNVNWWGNYDTHSIEYEPYDGVTSSTMFSGYEYYQSGNEPVTVISTHSFVANDGGVFFPNDGVTTMRIKRIMTEFSIVENGSRSFVYYPESVRMLLFYSDGSMEYVEDVTQNGTHDFSFSFTPTKNVVKFEVIARQTFNPAAGSSFTVMHALGEWPGDTLEITIDQESENTGLLKSIIEWLRSIKDGISNVFSSISELPGKIWSFIENGLKSLFVPSEDFIVQYKDKFDGLLSDKLGAVYQVAHLTFDGWDRLTNARDETSVTFPEVSIDLPEDASFTFGGYDVPIVPEGFESLVSLVKLAIGIVCTLAYINSLRKRFDDIMEVKT